METDVDGVLAIVLVPQAPSYAVTLYGRDSWNTLIGSIIRRRGHRPVGTVADRRCSPRFAKTRSSIRELTAFTRRDRQRWFGDRAQPDVANRTGVRWFVEDNGRRIEIEMSLRHAIQADDVARLFILVRNVPNADALYRASVAR